MDRAQVRGAVAARGADALDRVGTGTAGGKAKLGGALVNGLIVLGAEALSISADAMVHLPARRSGWRLLAPLGKAKFQGPDMARKD